SAYRQAVEEKYRFFSFGDAMLLVGSQKKKDLEDIC
ncbi:MAG: S-adenosylmethionine:tRNA ribosyltransferase-isomerase, partial [Selenomonadaceae bacterium]